MSEDKIKKKIKEYQTFVLKDIFSEYGLKEYINGIEKIVQKMMVVKKMGFVKIMCGKHEKSGSIPMS
jgi:hypothetical protein